MLSVAIWKRRAMPQTGLSGDTMPPTPRTGWWRVNLKRAGTGRSLTRRRSRARSPCVMRRRPHPLLIQLRSAFWLRTSKRSGMREPFTPNDSTALRDTLRPGDVLLVDGKGHISGSIKYLTQSTWSHSALYVGPMAGAATDGEPHVLIEANIDEGVVSAPL